MIAIVDYGVGNVRAIANMLKKVGGEAVVTNDAGVIRSADKVILPGVGAFDTAMQELDRSGLKEVLAEAALQQAKPFLGICLGMQLFTRGSEEGTLPGLGWIPATTYRFPPSAEKVPHMRWNSVRPGNSSPLLRELEADARFYFVHSYYVKTDDEKHSILQADYILRFDAAVQKDNIYGVQFHPEKSHRYGMKLLSNFVAL